MIRFRVGQSWRHEAGDGAGPRDAFTFELDGVNLVPGATDEPLEHVVSGLLDAVAGLAVDGEIAGELSLEDARLEVCFWRRPGLEVEVSVVDLAAGALTRARPVVVELPTLVEAAAHCGRSLARSLTSEGRAEAAGTLGRKLARLTGVVIEPALARPAAPHEAHRPPSTGLGYAVEDSEGRVGRWTRRARAGLPWLLAPGVVQADGGRPEGGWPVLRLMALARAASSGPQEVGGVSVTPEAIYSAGLELCLALRAHNGALASNPWLEALQVRCADGLKALKQPLPDLTPGGFTPGSASAASPPLPAAGALRRVGLALKWSRPAALGEDGARLTLGARLVVAHSPHAAHAFDSRGATVFRRLAARGVAIAATGAALVATPERLAHFARAGRSARWLRDHDGVSLGPSLVDVDGVLVTPLGRHGAAGFDALTGRERWRFDPPRTQQGALSVLGARVFLGTDSGSLYALDAADGQVRFRVRASLPCAGPTVPFGRLVATALCRGEHTVVFACTPTARDAATPAGTIRWTKELPLAQPSRLAVARSRLFLAGAREGRTWVVCLGARGQLRWERSVPCDARTTTLLPWDGGVIAADARGVCCRLGADGEVDWVLGGLGDELSHVLPLQQARRVLVVPGATVRLVNPADGRVLGELPPTPRLTALAVDRSLTVYTLTEPGTLSAYTPGTTLSLISSG
jgi:hypothetical protein